VRQEDHLPRERARTRARSALLRRVFNCSGIEFTHPRTAGSVALCGGIALYLFGHAMFRLRMTRSYGIHHLTAAGASLLLLAFAPDFPGCSAGQSWASSCLPRSPEERHELGALRRRLHFRAEQTT
jgi:hypothetical protein